MPASVAANFKEGSRSEILADYLFSQWGAVTPVRRSDDFGIDLFCTLSDRIGALAVVRDYFTVQVKSGTGPWKFEDKQSVKWLVEYPTPLFLACVEKKKGIVSVYHVMPRFYARAFARQDHLILNPGSGKDGESLWWASGYTFSLSAPIIRATISDLIDKKKMDRLRAVFQLWVSFDRENCDLARRGLLRFRMPSPYRVNEMPQGWIELGNAMPDSSDLRRGILTLAEDAECIGGQLFRLGDRAGALRAALLVDHLLKTNSEVFKQQPRWNEGIAGDLGMKVCAALDEALGVQGGGRYPVSGIEKVGKVLQENAAVKRFLHGSTDKLGQD